MGFIVNGVRWGGDGVCMYVYVEYGELMMNEGYEPDRAELNWIVI